MTRVLVTGGAGFIGSHLVDRLLREGHDVAVVDDLSTGSLANLAEARASHPDRLRIVECDITTPSLEGVVTGNRPEVVYHLAAQMDVRRSVDDPVMDATVNVLGTIRLLEAGRRAGVRKVVFTTSGGCIYGEPDPAALPVEEDYPGHPHSPYGAAKRGVEEYFHVYAALYDLAWTSLALGNVYGPRQDPRGEAGVVSIFGGRMLRGEPVTIYGDGEQSRDFVYVADVVDALVAAYANKGDGLRINVGSGIASSVNELFHRLGRVCGYEPEPVYAEERLGELRHIAVDVARAKRELDWSPRTDFDAGLEKTIAWLRTTQ